MSQKQEIEKLISKLQDEDKDARASVVWTLGWMVEEEVVDAEPALIQALQDSNPEVRAAVAVAFCIFGANDGQHRPSMAPAADRAQSGSVQSQKSRYKRRYG